MRLDTASNYQWHNVRRRDMRRPGRGRNLRWWIMLAIILSFALHALLVMLFSDLRIALFTPVAADRLPPQTVPITIEQESLAAPAPDTDIPDTLDPSNREDLLESLEMDILDLQRFIPEDREILLTPDVRTPENIAGDSGLESIDPTALESALAEAPAMPLELPAETPLSDNQLSIEAHSGVDDGLARELLDEATREGTGLDERYVTLDDLIGLPGGRITDITRPIYMPTDLLFDFASHELRESARASLMMLGMLIDRNPDTIFVIEGHTDTIGTEENNLQLSLRRADAVASWLQQSLRISDERLRIEGFGKSQPLVYPDGTPEQQQPNRRVEIRMLRPNGANAQENGESPASPAAPESGTPAPEIRPARPVDPSE